MNSFHLNMNVYKVFYILFYKRSPRKYDTSFKGLKLQNYIFSSDRRILSIFKKLDTELVHIRKQDSNPAQKEVFSQPY